MKISITAKTATVEYSGKQFEFNKNVGKDRKQVAIAMKRHLGLVGK